MVLHRNAAHLYDGPSTILHVAVHQERAPAVRGHVVEACSLRSLHRWRLEFFKECIIGIDMYTSMFQFLSHTSTST